MAEESLLVVNEDKGVSVVGFAEPTLLDAYHVSQVEKELTQLVVTGACRQLVLDFSTIQMLSSRSLGVLLSLRQELDKFGGKMVIYGIDPKLYRVFKITNLQSVFEFFDDKEAAINSFEQEV